MHRGLGFILTHTVAQSAVIADRLVLSGSRSQLCTSSCFPGSQFHHVLLQDGTTPVYMASQDGHIEVLRVLVDCKADINRPYEVPFLLWHAVHCDRPCAVFVWFALLPPQDGTRRDRVLEGVYVAQWW
jgi:hypothetical protein